jgi:rare lipoprotein A (peptidoglycan hydrolase)
MTVAVGRNSGYPCGQTLKIKNLSNGREIIATVVDQVPNYPENKVNLHRRAFETLGASLDAGIINVEITASPELEEEKWGKYLLEIVQAAYPNYKATDYSKVSKNTDSNTRMKEVYKFVMQSPQETMNIQGTVIYNPNTDRIISINFQEM